jgi:Rieske Fe-S protein
MHGGDGGSATHGRRAFVIGGATAALGAAGLASGCASGQEPDPVPATGTGATGTVLGSADGIPVGGGAIFEAFEVVVTQPTEGDFLGFSAVCTHTGCIVNEVRDGTINCPCHGSRYNLDGTVAAGPAPRPLIGRPVTVADGQVVVT